jgi:hypothetical protein
VDRGGWSTDQLIRNQNDFLWSLKNTLASKPVRNFFSQVECNWRK